MYVCMDGCMYACMYVGLYVFNVRMHACVRCVCVWCVQVCQCVWVHLCVSVCLWVYVCDCVLCVSVMPGLPVSECLSVCVFGIFEREVHVSVWCVVCMGGLCHFIVA